MSSIGVNRLIAILFVLEEISRRHWRPCELATCQPGNECANPQHEQKYESEHDQDWNSDNADDSLESCYQGKPRCVEKNTLEKRQSRKQEYPKEVPIHRCPGLIRRSPESPLEAVLVLSRTGRMSY